MGEFIRKLPGSFIPFYINLRGRFVRDYEDFMKVLFSVMEGPLKGLLADLLKSGLAYGGIPVPEELFKKLIGDENEDPFLFLENSMRELVERGRRPVLIMDELQVIGDLKLDGPLIYRLFNFFVRLTKETHLSHVFVVTSDSLFIEKIYREAMLQGRAEYFLVDDFDKETTMAFLSNHGLSKDEAELVWSYFGGKPVYLVEATKHRDELEKWCGDVLEEKTSWLMFSLSELRGRDRELFDGVIGLLNKIAEMEEVKCREIREEVLWLVRENILFLDPRKRFLKPQGRIELLAIRAVLEEMKGS